MKIHIYAHANITKGKVLAVNELGTEVAFGGASNMQTRAINYPDLSDVARMNKGYSRIVYGLDLAGVGALDAVRVVRTLNIYGFQQLKYLFADDGVVDAVCRSIISMPAFAADAHIIGGAHKWLVGRGLALSSGHGCYF